MPCKGTLAGAERPSRLRVSRLPSAVQHKAKGGTAQAHYPGSYQPTQIALLATLATARQNGATKQLSNAGKRCAIALFFNGSVYLLAGGARLRAP